MSKQQDIMDFYSDYQLTFYDNLDDAIIGVWFDKKTDGNAHVAYSKVVKIMMDKFHFSEEDATEYIDYNIIGLYTGESDPVVIIDDL